MLEHIVVTLLFNLCLLFLSQSATVLYMTMVLGLVSYCLVTVDTQLWPIK